MSSAKSGPTIVKCSKLNNTNESRRSILLKVTKHVHTCTHMHAWRLAAYCNMYTHRTDVDYNKFKAVPDRAKVKKGSAGKIQIK
jgi:hypothetical protein